MVVWRNVLKRCYSFPIREDFTAFGKHIIQKRAELESSYVEGKVIVCSERTRRPLCLRIRLMLALHQTSGPPTSTLLPWKASLRHDSREHGGSTELWVPLSAVESYELKVLIELHLRPSVNGFAYSWFVCTFIFQWNSFLTLRPGKSLMNLSVIMQIIDK